MKRNLQYYRDDNKIMYVYDYIGKKDDNCIKFIAHNMPSICKVWHSLCCCKHAIHPHQRKYITTSTTKNSLQYLYRKGSFPFSRQQNIQNQTRTRTLHSLLYSSAFITASLKIKVLLITCCGPEDDILYKIPLPKNFMLPWHTMCQGISTLRSTLNS